MNRAFSLVELSIVLVILGLLTGGILTGQSLIRAAELRAVTTELQAYQTATQTFRDKYFQYPGDMNNAIDFWGAADPTPATCLSTVGTGTQTCNGDGDGTIDGGVTSQYGERFTYWQHLANAGLIEGTYTGIAGTGGQLDGVPGENMPRSKLSNAQWYLDNMTSGAGLYFNLDYGNYLTIATDPGTGNNRLINAVFSPEEAWNIDTKVDDGIAVSGKVIALRVVDCTTSADENDFTGDYDLVLSGAQCGIIFRNLF